MRVALRNKRRTERRPPAAGRHTPLPTPAPQPEAAVPEEDTAPEHREERRMRASGGPEDKAFYRCACGCAFRAEVSTSVACPACGDGQAW